MLPVLLDNKKSRLQVDGFFYALYGGEAGIRTLGGVLALAGFQDRCFQPLSHLSGIEFRVGL